MGNKNALLWLVAIVALVVSVFSLAQTRIQPLKSDAAYLNRNLNPTITTINNPPIALAIQVDGIDVSEKHYNECRVSKTIAEFEECVRTMRFFDKPADSGQ